MKAKVSGFTLIELVVVITILGILVGVRHPQIHRARLAGARRHRQRLGRYGQERGLARPRPWTWRPAPAPSDPWRWKARSVTLFNNYPGPERRRHRQRDQRQCRRQQRLHLHAYGGTGATAIWTKIGAPTPASCTVIYTRRPRRIRADRGDHDGRLLASATSLAGGTDSRPNAAHATDSPPSRPDSGPGGYTLVELVVVMAVAGILAAVYRAALLESANLLRPRLRR